MVTTTKPFGTFFVESAQQAASTTIAIAWITWWSLVVGFVVHFLFLDLGFIPSRASAQVAEVSIELNYKLVLNVFATIFFVFLYWSHRQDSVAGERRGGEEHADMTD
ncbi:hypothetical protein GJR96_16245 [Haloferax sp. MBLA0076]|uniref:Uncharacterized protein n=1 Tax=Haloferax litoreum TaxID=2666140 RepID=A0A6A8GL41_9EURY|nr:MULTISPECIES: hypothetical protein [Haloferax]KAB1190520.1 hypothetical protein Hfx1148_16190 [Haloferax sp. CBA1148]MRX23501.1 hypothetical protein [Haloferax litoreum]